MAERSILSVVRASTGSWELRRGGSEVLARYSSEEEARDAGRAAAEASGADLVLHPPDGPPQRETYDPAAGGMLPAGARHDLRRDASGSGDRKRLILLVEDMLDARELYAEYLTYAGFSVVTAINGHEALGLARLLRPDLVLMDIRLPGMDGLEATADIKADPATADIPVVAITADSSPELHERAIEAGCADVITKPVLPDEVGRRITALLTTASAQRHRS